MTHLWRVDVIAQYQTNGNAVQTSCNCYQLTAAAGNQSGSVWNVNLIDLSQPFNFSFDVFLGCNDNGADGMAFVLQPLSVNAGTAGGGIGYQGISPSLAVEMDTYQNATDPWYDHMALQTNGVVTHGGANTLAGPVQTSATSPNVEDCQWHLFQVSWNPATQLFQVWFDGALRLSYTGNIINNIFGGNPMVYWGFTAATGGANNLHQFCNALSPSFTVTPASQCVGLPVQFNSTSIVATGQITGFTWNFGDGNSGTGVDPAHTYTAAGTYTVTLTITSEGCTESFSTTVTINPIPVANVGPDVPICLGDGVQMTPTSIDPNATYSWSPATGVSNPNVANPMIQTQVTTTYTMTVTGQGGCQASDDVTIIVNPLPVADAGDDQTTCAGVSVALAGSGGNSYSWTPADNLLTPNQPSTEAAPDVTTVYTLTVTDGNNCSNTDDVTVTVLPLPSVSAGTDVAVCAGQTTQLNASGASGYQWSPAAGLSDAYSAAPVFSGLSSTSYTVTGTDANGCSNTASVFITVNPLPNVSAGNDIGICIGDAVGLTATGADSYVWSPATDLSDPASAQPTFTGLATQTLTVTGTDGNGCVNTNDVTVTVNPLPVVSAGPDTPLCDGLTLQLNATGAVSYVWAPADDLNDATIASPEFTGTTDATLTVTGTDANGCVNTDDINITVSALPTVDAGNDNAICEGEDIQLGATGGIGYSWSPSAGLSDPGIQNPVFTASVTTTFTVTATDGNGCQDTGQVTITVHPLPEAVISPISSACLGNPTYFSENSIGNIVDYAWTLGNNETSSDPAHSHTYAAAQTYPVTLTVTDDNGCLHQATSEAVVHPLPVVSMSITNGPDFCEFEPISFQNTSPGQPAAVSWNFAYQPGLPAQPGFSSTVNNPQFNYPVYGTYNVRLLMLDNNGCFDEAVQTINIHATPTAEFSFNIACEGNATAFNSLSSIPGNSVINGWQWDFGDNSAIAYPENPVHTYAEDGTYTVGLIVQTNQGCRDTVAHEVWVNPTPVVGFSATSVCAGGETEFTNSTVPQDATITSWAWNFGNGQTADTQTATHLYATHGSYTVTLMAETDSGCAATGTGAAVVYPIPIPDFSVINAEGCEPHTASFFNNSTVASGGIASFQWDFGVNAGSAESSPTHTYADTVGTFDVTLTVVSNQGCSDTLVQEEAVTVHVTPVADFSQSADLITIDRPWVDFTDLSQDAVTYQWTFGNGSTSSQSDPSIAFMEPGDYVITLTVVNGMCSHSHSSTLKVDALFTFYIPNAFTPNANGRNDRFRAEGEGFEDYSMSIYDRWGKIIFQSGSHDLGWDGTYLGKAVPNGVYIYRFVVTDWSGEEHVYHGGFTLIR